MKRLAYLDLIRDAKRYLLIFFKKLEDILLYELASIKFISFD